MPDKRFLVVRLGSLGDIVHTFPAVAALRESFPTSQIIWLTHPRWVPLVESAGLATEIWPLDSRDLASVLDTLRQIRASAWDAAIDYQGLWKSALPPFLGGASRRIGFSSAAIREYGVPILYTDRVPVSASHIAEQNGELSLRAGAVKPVSAVHLRVDELSETLLRPQFASQGVLQYIVLSPGGGWLSKCWPPDRFGLLSRRIFATLGLRSVINYGPGEQPLLSAVQAASGTSEPLPYTGDLPQLMALLRNAACIVAGDTGPLHLAAALGTPAVALFGPTNPARNGPYPINPQDIILRSPNAITSYKRGDSPDSSLLELSVNQVFEAVQRRIGAPA
jgi:lipopolysaccharide heptosyltransferase I